MEFIVKTKQLVDVDTRTNTHVYEIEFTNGSVEKQIREGKKCLFEDTLPSRVVRAEIRRDNKERINKARAEALKKIARRDFSAKKK